MMGQVIFFPNPITADDRQMVAEVMASYADMLRENAHSIVLAIAPGIDLNLSAPEPMLALYARGPDDWHWQFPLRVWLCRNHAQLQAIGRMVAQLHGLDFLDVSGPDMEARRAYHAAIEAEYGPDGAA